MTKILIIDDEDPIRGLLQLILESEFDNEILFAPSGNAAINILEKNQDIGLILSDYSMPDGNGSVVFNYNSHHKNLPFILITGGFLEDYNDIKNFFETNRLNRVVSKPFSEEEIICSVKKVLSTISDCAISTPITRLDQYIRVRISSFKHFTQADVDIYLKLNEGHFVKIHRQQDKIDSELILKYQIKGEHFFYFIKEDFLKIKKFALQKVNDQILMADNLKEAMMASGEALGLICSGAELLGIDEDQVELINASVQSCLSNLEKDETLKALIPILKREQGHLVAHSITALHLCFIISKEMAIYGPQIMEKFSYACLLHDMILCRSELSAIFDPLKSEDFSKLSSADKKLVLDHPMQASYLAKSVKNFSMDVEKMIQEHHERPDGSGFPKGLKGSSISPLGAILIFSLDISDYLYFHEHEGALKFHEYLDSKKAYYNVGHFSKPHQALRRLLENMIA